MAEHPGHAADAAASVADATPGASVRPWYRATLVLGCPTCDAPPGGACVARVVSGRPVLRRAFHVARYELARELAGEPIVRRAGAAPLL